MPLDRTIARLTLLVFIIVTTVGAFNGGLWAGAAIGAAIILYAATWIADSRRIVPPAPTLSRPLKLAGAVAAVAGIGALLFFTPALVRFAVRGGAGRGLAKSLIKFKWARLLAIAPTMSQKFLPKLMPKILPRLLALSPLSIKPDPQPPRWLRHAPPVDGGWALIVGITLIVMALLNLGSSQPAHSAHMELQLAGVFLPLLALTSPRLRQLADHRLLFILLLGTIMLGVFLLGIELKTGTPLLHLLKGAKAQPTDYNRGLSYVIILSLPVMAALSIGIDRQQLASSTKPLWHLRVWLLPLVALLLLIAGLTESRAARLGLLLALPTTGLAYLWPVATRWLLTATVCLLPVWPFAARALFLNHRNWVAALPDSWRARIEIWDYMSYRIAEHPWLGWGLGTSNSLDFLTPHGALYQFTTIAPGHPHNAATELWVELGLPGLALGIAFALFSLRQAAKLDRRLTPFAFGAWVAALVLSLVAYNFWTDSMFGAFALTGFAFGLLDARLKAAAIAPVEKSFWRRWGE